MPRVGVAVGVGGGIGGGAGALRPASLQTQTTKEHIKCA